MTKSKLYIYYLDLVLFLQAQANSNCRKFHFRYFVFWSCQMIFVGEQVFTVSFHFCILYASLPHCWNIWYWNSCTSGKEQLVDFSFASVFLGCFKKGALHRKKCTCAHEGISINIVLLVDCGAQHHLCVSGRLSGRADPFHSLGVCC